jgi:hypothetical protein
MTRPRVLLPLVVLLSALAAAQGPPPAPFAAPVRLDDLDGDGVPDELEARLLQRFAPTWMISAEECDLLPAELRRDTPTPTVVARNGTIYGQVSPSPHRSGDGVSLEIRYHHLWARDCGRAGHDLDAERVAALVHAGRLDAPPGDWAAVYWFAAAHEGTVCDSSHGAAAVALGAQASGPRVWISRGKHASYLAEPLCGGGCGGDRCPSMRPFVARQVINLGETASPLNGAVWVASNRWTLSERTGPVFTPAVLARLGSPEPARVVSLHDTSGTMKTVVMVGGVSAAAFNRGRQDAGAAVATGSTAAVEGGGTGLAHAGRAFGRACRAVARFLGF